MRASVKQRSGVLGEHFEKTERARARDSCASFAKTRACNVADRVRARTSAAAIIYINPHNQDK